MKILFLNHNIRGMGTYIRCFHFAKHLVKLNHSVTILTSTPKYILSPKKIIINGVKVICMPDILKRRYRNGGLGPLDTIFRCLFLLNNKFNLVENFDHRPAVLYPALISKYLMRIPLVSEWTDLHGTGGSMSNRSPALQRLIRSYEDISEQKSKKLPERLIVISQGLKERAIKIGIPEYKIRYIPGGADIDNIQPLPKRKVRRQFNLPIGKKLIGYTAGTHYEIENVVRSVNVIQKNRSDVYFVTTGAYLDEKYRSLLFDEKRLIEMGFLDYDSYRLFLPAVDVFLFSFKNRSLNIGRWPNKIGDYMAAGRPIVSNRTGDLIDLFEKHQIGLLASDDPEDLAEKVLTILADNNMNCVFGSNARKCAENYYAWNIQTRKLENCFFEVLSNSKTS